MIQNELEYLYSIDEVKLRLTFSKTYITLNIKTVKKTDAAEREST